MEQWSARRAHNPKVGSSNLSAATNIKYFNMSKLKSKFTPHFKASLFKSIVRVMGFSILMSSIPLGVAILIIAEIISIGEELV